MKHEITIATLNFEIHEPFRRELTTLIETLFHHREEVRAIKVTIEGDYRNHTAISYCVRMDVTTKGPDIFASARAEHLLSALRSTIEIAERRLIQRMSIREEECLRPHTAVNGHELPKTMTAP